MTTARVAAPLFDLEQGKQLVFDAAEQGVEVRFAVTDILTRDGNAQICCDIYGAGCEEKKFIHKHMTFHRRCLATGACVCGAPVAAAAHERSGAIASARFCAESGAICAARNVIGYRFIDCKINKIGNGKLKRPPVWANPSSVKKTSALGKYP